MSGLHPSHLTVSRWECPGPIDGHCSGYCHCHSNSTGLCPGPGDTHSWLRMRCCHSLPRARLATCPLSLTCVSFVLPAGDAWLKALIKTLPYTSTY